jgi:hypothetical protein
LNLEHDGHVAPGAPLPKREFVVGAVFGSNFTSASASTASISLSSNCDELLDLTPVLRR